MLRAVRMFNLEFQIPNNMFDRCSIDFMPFYLIKGTYRYKQAAMIKGPVQNAPNTRQFAIVIVMSNKPSPYRNYQSATRTKKEKMIRLSVEL